MRRVVIMGAGGRDFHVFNTCYRDDAGAEVVAFTAAQIPTIESRTYPPELAGPRYPEGIPIVAETELEEVVRARSANEVVFAYSDVPESALREAAARVEPLGAAFLPFDPEATMLESARPCVAVCAVRTGCGKSGVSRRVTALLRELGKSPVVVRHPMPYGNLRRQVVQRFARIEDLAAQDCTIEEMEEYEPHIEAGHVVFAGADYAQVLAAAEREGDVLVWDGGNNDVPFLRPDLLVTLVDPLRPGHERTYFPGRWNVEHADAIVIAKTDEAPLLNVQRMVESVRELNERARIVYGLSPVAISDAEAVRGKRVLVIEDGPTATHGGMGYGAGFVAALRAQAGHVVDPRPYAVGSIARAFESHPHLRAVLPALGYGRDHVADLEATIERAECDVVVIGTPIDLSRVVRIAKPHVRVTYGFEEESKPGLRALLEGRFGG